MKKNVYRRHAPMAVMALGYQGWCTLISYFQHWQWLEKHYDKHDRKALPKAKYFPWVAAISCTQQTKNERDLDLWPWYSV